MKRQKSSGSPLLFFVDKKATVCHDETIHKQG
jgi:hypothetical protein